MIDLRSVSQPPSQAGSISLMGSAPQTRAPSEGPAQEVDLERGEGAVFRGHCSRDSLDAAPPADRFSRDRSGFSRARLVHRPWQLPPSAVLC